MPVVFVIDPNAARPTSRTITLSYTFFEVEGRGRPSSDGRGPAQPRPNCEGH